MGCRDSPGCSLSWWVSLTSTDTLHHHLSPALQVFFYTHAWVCTQVFRWVHGGRVHIVNMLPRSSSCNYSVSYRSFSCELKHTLGRCKFSRYIGEGRGKFETQLSDSNASSPLCLHPRIPSLGFSRTLMKWRGKWQPTPVFLTGESQGQRSRLGCRLWGHTESDTADAT